MADLTKYNGLIAWRTIAKDVFQLTRATTGSPGTYRMIVKSEDTNDKGHGQKDTTCWFTDYLGSPYSIIAVDTNTIDVSDVFRTGYCPTSGKTGYIHKSAYKGQSIALPSHTFRHLSSLAASNNNKFAMSILWGNQPNPLRIPFTGIDIPSITGYQSEQTIEGKIYNLAEDYGENPKVRIMQIDESGNTIYRTELSYFQLVDGLIDSIVFGTLPEVINGYLEISR